VLAAVAGGVLTLWQAVGDGFQQAARRARGDYGVAGGDGAYCRQQVRRLCVLEQKAARASPQSGIRVFVEVEGGEDDDPRAPAGRHELARRFNAVEDRHPDVHQNEVWVKPRCHLDDFAAVGSVADNLKVCLGIEDHTEAHACSWSSASRMRVVIA
jgi:hypothetical protein